MKKSIIIGLVCFTLNGYAQIDLNKIKGELGKVVPAVTSGNIASLSDADIIQGLKEALTKGSGSASSNLNKVDGFYKNPRVKIPIPSEVATVVNTLRSAGFGSKVDEFEKSLNRAGEQAAKEAAPIFKKAITDMTFNDARKILTGKDTAATSYLRGSTYTTLYKSFTPHVKKGIGDNGVASKWTELTKLYNKIPLVKKPVNTDLVSYTTHKALGGLFTLVADEELKIRKDPVARTTDILQKVFGSTK